MFSRFSLLFCLATLLCRETRAADLPELWSVTPLSIAGSSPAIASDGTIYVAASGYTNFHDFSGGKLVAVSPQGKVRWEFKTFCDIKASPAIGNDGTVFFGSRDRKFHAVSPQGKARWEFVTGDWIDSSAAIAKDGTVYFGGWDKKFYALNPDGGKKWALDTGGPIDSSPAIARDGTIYFGSHDKKFYALNPDGSQKWVFATGGPIVSSPALNCDGSIYFTSVDGNLYVLNADGTQKIKLKTGGYGTSSPVIDIVGNIYLCTTNFIQCFSGAGNKKWDWGYPEMDGAAALAADGTAYFAIIGDYGVGVVLAFDANGDPVAHADVGSAVTGSPAIADDGTVYVGSGSGFFALKGTASPAKSCWPKFRGNAAQNGRLDR
jgi:outer membrane protein assembly factor BamB